MAAPQHLPEAFQVQNQKLSLPVKPKSDPSGNQNMGLPVTEARCKKHPKHRQSAGVCSVCLSERLSKLALFNNTKANRHHASCSSSSDVSSSYSTVSSPSSPAGVRLEGVSKVFFSGPIGDRAMFRSRSMAVVAESRESSGAREAAKDRRRKGTGSGFWSKLMRVASKRRKEELFHSKTAKGPALDAWIGARN